MILPRSLNPMEAYFDTYTRVRGDNAAVWCLQRTYIHFCPRRKPKDFAFSIYLAFYQP